mgnify:CR=1 FL=1
MGIELETSPATAPKRKYTHRRSPEERRRLTAKQQTVYDLRQSGKTFKEVSAIVGRGIQTVVECYRTAERKVLNLKTDENNPKRLPIEERLDPMDAAQAIDRLTDPFAKLSAVAQECGLKPELVSAITRRMKTRYLGVTEQMRAIKTHDMIQKIDERIGHALTYIDDYVMADANFRDLAMGVAQLVEKRQLLKGEPTQIVSVDERKTLNQLLPLLIQEAARRGVTIPAMTVIEGKAETVAVPAAQNDGPAEKPLNAGT